MSTATTVSSSAQADPGSSQVQRTGCFAPLPLELVKEIFAFLLASQSSFEEKKRTFQACCHTPGLVQDARSPLILRHCLLDIFSAYFNESPSRSPHPDEIRKASDEELLSQLYALSSPDAQAYQTYCEGSLSPPFQLSKQFLILPKKDDREYVSTVIRTPALANGIVLCPLTPDGHMRQNQHFEQIPSLFDTFTCDPEGCWLAVSEWSATRGREWSAYHRNADGWLVRMPWEGNPRVATSPTRFASQGETSITVYSIPNFDRPFYKDFGSNERIEKVALAQDGKWIAIQTIRNFYIGNIETNEHHSIKRHFQCFPQGFCWIPNTTLLVVSIRRIDVTHKRYTAAPAKLWLYDVATGEKTALLERHNNVTHLQAVGERSIIFESNQCIYYFDTQTKTSRMLKVFNHIIGHWLCNSRSFVFQLAGSGKVFRFALSVEEWERESATLV